MFVCLTAFSVEYFFKHAVSCGLVKERKMSSEVPWAHSDREANKSRFANCNIYLAAVGQPINQRMRGKQRKIFLVQKFL